MYILIGIICIALWAVLFVLCANAISAVYDADVLFLTKYIVRFNEYTMDHIDFPGMKIIRFIFGFIYTLFFPITTSIDILIILINA